MQPSRTGHVLLWAGAILILVGVAAGWSLLPVKGWVQSFTAWVHGFGPWGPVLFAIAYVGAVVLMAPAEPLTIAAGLVFGMWGFPLALGSAILGALLAFLISRYFFRARLKQFIDKRPSLHAIDCAVEQAGWRIVFLLRLSVLVPFSLQNYVFGATRIGFLPYAAATSIGIIPGAALYVYLGILGQEAAAGDAGILARAALFALAFLATVAIAVIVTAKAKAILRALSD